MPRDADKAGDVEQCFRADPGMGPQERSRLDRCPGLLCIQEGLGRRCWPAGPSLPPSLTDDKVLEALRGGSRLAADDVRRGGRPVRPLFPRRPPRRRPLLAGRRRLASRCRHGHAPGDQFRARRATASSMIGHSGQSSTQVVIMTDPPESYAVIPLGESDHKESGHWDDQAEKLFSKGKALRTYFMRPDELMKHVTSKKVLHPTLP